MAAIFCELLDGFRTCLEALGSAEARDAVRRIGWDMPGRPLEPRPLACLQYLSRAAELAPAVVQPLVRLLAGHCDEVHWGQTYTEADFGRHFIDNYGWVELFGTRGHFANETVAGGFLVLGPGVVYPDHHHIAEEIYVPLTGGTEWRMGEGGFRPRAAGEAIHHASNVSHAMRTGSEPLLALYVWHGGPLAQKSTVTGAVARGEV